MYLKYQKNLYKQSNSINLRVFDYVTSMASLRECLIL